MAEGSRHRVWIRKAALGIALAGLALGLVAGREGYMLLKYRLPRFVSGAASVPDFMVEARFERFDDEAALALRRGACSDDVVRITRLLDGSAIMTCGLPDADGAVRVYTARSADVLAFKGLVGN